MSNNAVAPDAPQQSSNKGRLHRQNGNTLFEFLLVAALVARLLVWAYDAAMDYADDQTNRAAANHATMVVRALDRYQKQNYASILAASATGPVPITMAMLRNTGALPASVADTNPYGQGYTASARRSVYNGTPIVEILLTSTGGEQIKNQHLRNIAGQIEGGGFITAEDPGVAKGALGAWQVPLSTFGLPANGGHLATALFFNEAGAITDYLYRNAVPGRPEVNRMNASIDMGGNDLNNTRNVNAVEVTAADAVTANSALKLQATNGAYSGGWYMADNTWLRSINDKNIYTGGTVLATNVQAYNQVSGASLAASGAISGASLSTSGQIYSGSSIVSAGTIYGAGQITGGAIYSQGALTGAGRITAGEYVQINGGAAAGGGCGPNGLVGREGDGSLLSCVNGIWTKPGGAITVNGSTCPPGSAPVSYLISDGISAPYWYGAPIAVVQGGGGGDAGTGYSLALVGAYQVKCVY